jgi:hypothetical protein
VDSQASLITAERRPIGAGLLLPIDSVRRTEAAVYQASLATQRAVSDTAPPLSRRLAQFVSREFDIRVSIGDR